MDVEVWGLNLNSLGSFLDEIDIFSDNMQDTEI